MNPPQYHRPPARARRRRSLRAPPEAIGEARSFCTNSARYGCKARTRGWVRTDTGFDSFTITVRVGDIQPIQVRPAALFHLLDRTRLLVVAFDDAHYGRRGSQRGTGHGGPKGSAPRDFARCRHARGDFRPSLFSQKLIRPGNRAGANHLFSDRLGTVIRRLVSLTKRYSEEPPLWLLPRRTGSLRHVSPYTVAHGGTPVCVSLLTLRQ